MQTQIQSIHFDADKKLTDFVQSKVDKLNKIYNRIESCNVILKLDKNSKTKNKVVELSVLIPGCRLFASDRAETYEMATDVVVDEIIKQLHKHKEKITSTELSVDDRILLKGK